MDKIDIVLWAVGLGFTFNFALMRVLFNKIEKNDEKLTDIDRRLCRIEGSMAAKECCMLKETHHSRKAQ